MTSVTDTTNKRTSKNIPSLEDFCNLTQKAFAPYHIDVSTVLCSTDGWTSLADLWEELIFETQKDLFTDALHLIKWGIPLSINEHQAYHNLVWTICEALLCDTPAYCAWINHYFCKCCIHGITLDNIDQRWHPETSHEHCHFLSAQAILKIWRYAHGHKTECNEAAGYIARYKAKIMRLIPQARHWNDDDWLNESNIFGEILRIHNIDFRSNLAAYRVLHRLLDSPITIPKTVYSSAINWLIRLEVCSPSLISAIWPVDGPDSIIKLFLLTEKTARYWFEACQNTESDEDGWRPTDTSYRSLKQSWIFAHVNQQLHSSNIPHCYASKVKQAILNVELRS